MVFDTLVVVRKLFEIWINSIPLVLTHVPFLGILVLISFENSLVILFHHITVGTMCIIKSINLFFWVTCSMCLYFINAIISAYSQLPCLCHIGSHPTFADLVILLFALLTSMPPLLTPLPPISEWHCCIVYCRNWRKVMHLHSRGNFATLGETSKDIVKECEACYNSGVLVLKFQVEVWR